MAARHSTAEYPLVGDTCGEDHGHRNEDVAHGNASVVLGDHDGAEGQQGVHAQEQKLLPAVDLLVHLAQMGGEGDNKQDLADFARLDGDRADLDPALVAARIPAKDKHGQLHGDV